MGVPRGFNRVFPLIQLFFLKIQAIPTSKSGNIHCLDGYYGSSKGCSPCSSCLDSEIVIQPCTFSSDTACFPCNVNSTTNQQYVVARASSSLGRQCKNCTSCAQLDRKEIARCSTVKDSVCGGCLEGYFLGVDKEARVKCLPCSLCPPGDDTVTKWRECQEAGLEPDRWCSPGIMKFIVLGFFLILISFCSSRLPYCQILFPAFYSSYC